MIQLWHDLHLVVVHMIAEAIAAGAGIDEHGTAIVEEKDLVDVFHRVAGAFAGSVEEEILVIPGKSVAEDGLGIVGEVDCGGHNATLFQ